MIDDRRLAYVKYRLEKAKRCIQTAELAFEDDDYATAVSKSYYAVFHAMRSVLAIDNVDFKKHSAVISYFRREYIKTGVFDKSFSDIIGNLFDERGSSDYDDFYIVSKEDVIRQIENAKVFLEGIEEYINSL